MSVCAVCVILQQQQQPVSEVMAQRLSEAAAAVNPEQIVTQLFTRAKTFFLDLKAKIAWVFNNDHDDDDDNDDVDDDKD